MSDDRAVRLALEVAAAKVRIRDLEEDRERLQGEVERLEIEKHDLVERLEVATTLLRLEGGTP